MSCLLLFEPYIWMVANWIDPGLFLSGGDIEKKELYF